MENLVASRPALSIGDAVIVGGFGLPMFFARVEAVELLAELLTKAPAQPAEFIAALQQAGFTAALILTAPAFGDPLFTLTLYFKAGVCYDGGGTELRLMRLGRAGDQATKGHPCLN